MRKFFLVLALALSACGPQQADEKLNARVQQLEDERELTRIADALDTAVDAKDWNVVRALFTDQVAADFTTLGAAETGTVAADDLINNWRLNLHPGKTSARSRNSERVTLDGDSARMVSQGHVRYEIPARTAMNVWEGWGRFEHSFVRTPQGWRINGFKFTLERETGEPSVRAEAAPAEPESIVAPATAHNQN